MNFLAHAYLSFEDPGVLTGNLISDFVKGNKKLAFPPRIRQGIDLHRAIDAFADDHEVTKAASRLFQNDYGRYRLAFMDVVYDHFLAVELASRQAGFFRALVNAYYQQLDAYAQWLPPGFQAIFPYMKQQDWLFNYQYRQGLRKSFQGLVHRARYLSDSGPACEIFEAEYPVFQEAYQDFFPDVLDFSLKKFVDIH